MGVKSHVLWLCWMIRSFVVYLILSFTFTVIATRRFTYKAAEKNGLAFNLLLKITNQTFPSSQIEDIHLKALFLNTHFSVLFLTCIIYSWQLTCFSILIGQVFRKGIIF